MGGQDVVVFRAFHANHDRKDNEYDYDERTTITLFASGRAVLEDVDHWNDDRSDAILIGKTHRLEGTWKGAGANVHIAFTQWKREPYDSRSGVTYKHDAKIELVKKGDGAVIRSAHGVRVTYRNLDNQTTCKPMVHNKPEAVEPGPDPQPVDPHELEQQQPPERPGHVPLAKLPKRKDLRPVENAYHDHRDKHDHDKHSQHTKHHNKHHGHKK